MMDLGTESVCRGSQREEYLGSGSSAHQISAGPESTLDSGSMLGLEEGEGGQSREEGQLIDLGLPSEDTSPTFPKTTTTPLQPQASQPPQQQSPRATVSPPPPTMPPHHGGSATAAHVAPSLPIQLQQHEQRLHQMHVQLVLGQRQLKELKKDPNQQQKVTQLTQYLWNGLAQYQRLQQVIIQMQAQYAQQQQTTVTVGTTPPSQEAPPTIPQPKQAPALAPALAPVPKPVQQRERFLSLGSRCSLGSSNTGSSKDEANLFNGDDLSLTERSLLQSQRGQQELAEVPSAKAPSEIESLQNENQILRSQKLQQLRQLKALQGEVAFHRERQREATEAARVMRERVHLRQQTLHLQAKLQNLEQDLQQSRQHLSHSGDTVREQGREIQRLTAENLELRNDLEIERLSYSEDTVKDQGREIQRLTTENLELMNDLEIERVKAVTFQEDFQQERRDRESAHTKVAEMETRYTHQLQTMGEAFYCTATELKAQKQNLANTEAMMMKVRQKLVDKEQEISQKNQEIDHLREEGAANAQLLASLREWQDEAAMAAEVVRERDNLRQKTQSLEEDLQQSRQQLSHSGDTVREQGREIQRLTAENLELRNDLEIERLSHSEDTVKDQGREIQRLTTENLELKNDLEIERVKAVTFQEDYEQERQDLQLSRQHLCNSEDTVIEQRREIQRLTAENLELRNDLEIEKVTRQPNSPDTELELHKVQSFKHLEADHQVGSGSYGSVHIIEVNGIPCIAKRLHNILLGRGGMEDVGDHQRQPVLEKFQWECVLLSRLRHPNIVQFMGVHYGQNSTDLTLIMEYLHMDLEKCVKSYPTLPLPLKISILLDVSYGLLHLHSQTPPIIHRDLSADNVLLTAGMQAKIADLGVSKYLDTQKQTAVPGTPAYMPPEAQKKEADYSTKLDNFSFGVVVLYVTVQEFPEVGDDTTITVESVQKQETQIQKRITWIRKVGDHCLRPLILHCLQDLPERRPTTAKVNDDLKQLGVRYPRRFKDILEMQQHLERLERKSTKGV